MPSYSNRLDALPYDCLQYVLQFCSDHIIYDFKKNFIYSTPFQSKLKEKYLEIEYPVGNFDRIIERKLCKILFNDHPVSSFEITSYNNDTFFGVKIFYRKFKSNKKFLYKKMKPDTDENKEWNEIAKIFNEKTNISRKLVMYQPVEKIMIWEKEFESENTLLCSKVITIN